jgi:hypothetical protein
VAFLLPVGLSGRTIAGGGSANCPAVGVVSGSDSAVAGGSPSSATADTTSNKVGGGGASSPSPTTALTLYNAFQFCRNCLRGLSCRDCLRHGDGLPLTDAAYKAYVKRPTSLDSYVSSSNSTHDLGTRWNRQQKRAYQRCLSVVSLWQQAGYQVLWLMLSTAVGGDATKLAYHHQRLMQQVSYVSKRYGVGRKVVTSADGYKSRVVKRDGTVVGGAADDKVFVLGYAGMQHFSIRTDEGNGVLHLLWAWKGKRSFYIPQAWLSDAWRSIHGACVVWVARVGGGTGDVARLSRYMVSQYCSGQAGFKYMSYSWRKSFGFPLVSCWRAFKRSWAADNGYGRRSAMLAHWHRFLGGAALPFNGGLWLTMSWFKASYRAYGAGLWSVLSPKVAAYVY